MLKLLSVNSGNANLKFLGYSSALGKNGRSINNAKIIKPSITGIWESYDEF